MKKIFVTMISLIMLSVGMMYGERPIGNQAPQDHAIHKKARKLQPGESFGVYDTVVVKKTYTRYLTGQHVDKWVFYAPHVLTRIGGRFPKGVYIGNIDSWADPNGLLLLSKYVAPVAPAVDTTVVDTVALSDEVEPLEIVIEDLFDYSDLDDLYQADTLIDIEPISMDPVENVAPAKVSRVDTVEHVDTVHHVDTVEHISYIERVDTVERISYIERVDTILVIRVDTVYRDVEKASAVQQYHGDILHRLGIGAHVGAASLMQRTQDDVLGKGRLGFSPVVDIEYAFYKPVGKEQRVWLGLQTGVSVGYARSSMRSPVDMTYSGVADADNVAPQQVDYHVTSEQMRETEGQVQVEIPLHFALKHVSGFYMQFGPKVMVPVFSHYSMQANDNSRVDVRYPELGYTVWNELVTGRFTEQNSTAKGQFRNAQVHVSLDLHAGYEWLLRSENSLALGAYATYSAWNNYKSGNGDTPLLEIGAPQADGALLQLHSIMDAAGAKVGYWDAGVKLTYHFNFWKK